MIKLTKISRNKTKNEFVSILKGKCELTLNKVEGNIKKIV
jgi:uncharacterized cupin superfamily protein